MANRKQRIEKILELQQARENTVVVSYVTSTRPNLEAPMAIDVVPIIHAHLRAMCKTKADTKIDLFLHSNGGDSVVPWRLVSLIREFCSEFNVLVPCRAFSAGTLTCLGADNVFMHPMGMLGPTDPTVTTPYNPPNPQNPQQFLGISVEDVASYVALVKDDVGIRHEDELVQAFRVLADKVHPLALGSVKRATSQARMLGEKLLRRRVADKITQSDVDEIIEKLSSRLYYHGHPINRNEAREDLGLKFVKDPTPEVEKLMWELYELYAEEMKLDSEFQPIQETYDPAALPLPAAPQMVGPGQFSATTISISTKTVGPLKTVYVESAARTDVRTQSFEVTLRRQWTGELGAAMTVLAAGWEKEN